jgi:hypothetical protein
MSAAQVYRSIILKVATEHSHLAGQQLLIKLTGDAYGYTYIHFEVN